jgi:hypothetical protein
MTPTLTIETATEAYRSLAANISETERENSKAWYRMARCHAHAVALTLGVSLECGASILSAFSPRVTWNRNCVLAHAFANGEVVACLGNSIRAAERAKTMGFGALNGKKTNAFARNIAGDLNAVTIDAWMLRPFGMKSVSVRNYRILSEAIRTVAAESGMTPADMQALLWIRIRGKDA